MSSSLFAKRSTLLHAIVITLILALLSGSLPLQFLSPPLWSSVLPVDFPLGK